MTSHPLTAKEIEAGAKLALMETSRFYRCYFCGSETIPAFHEAFINEYMGDCPCVRFSIGY